MVAVQEADVVAFAAMEEEDDSIEHRRPSLQATPRGKGFVDKLRSEVGSESSTQASTPPHCSREEDGLEEDPARQAPLPEDSDPELRIGCQAQVEEAELVAISDADGLSGSPTPCEAVAEALKGQDGSSEVPEVADVKEDEAETQERLLANGKLQKRKGCILFNGTLTDYPVVPKAAEGRGWRVVRADDRVGQCNVHWIDFGVVGDWLPRIEPWMRVNHFPGMNGSLARKTRLARNIARMQRLFPKDYQFIPPTWILPDDLGDLERRIADGNAKHIYIVKPDHQAQGRGIYLTTDLDRLRKTSVESREKDQTAVVQRYITRPMLIDGLKFDLRIYFLICAVLTDTGLEPRCYLFKDGLVRLCTNAYEPPTPETLDDRCMHLTNYAVNKKSKHFQQPDADNDGTGNKRSLRWFMSYVEEQFGQKERQKLWTKIMGLCVKMLLTVQPTLEAEYHSIFPKDLTGGQMGCRCFELLGIDVMLDAKRKPYLLEVNQLPSFTCDSPLDEDIKGRLLEQTFDITCGSLCPKDKKTYEALVRERREAKGSTSEAKREWLMDLPEYKDFERAFPIPDTSPKLKAQCEAILARVREVFRPVQTMVRQRTDSADAPPAANKIAAAAKPPPAPSKEAARPPVPAPPKSSVPIAARHNSAPGPRPPLPRLARSSSPSPLRRVASARVHGPAARAELAGSARSVPPQRECLQLKSAHILL